jgi:hypothetical protein
VFVKQVVYGLQRYKKMIKAFVDELYLRHASEVNREDMPIYSVLSYLVLIRLDELTWLEFKRFTGAYEDIKMVCVSAQCIRSGFLTECGNRFLFLRFCLT